MPESFHFQRASRELPDSFQRVARQLSESCQRAFKELSESCQRAFIELPESFQRAGSCQRAFREQREIFQRLVRKRLARGLSNIWQHPCTETCGDKIVNSFSVCNCSLSQVQKTVSTHALRDTLLRQGFQ